MKKTMSVYLVCLAVMLSSAMGSTPVLDTDGDEVRGGVEYRFSMFGPGFVDLSLTLRPTGNKPCPLDVYEAGFGECQFNPTCGLPVTFHPEEGDLVTLSTDLNIKFNTTTSCEESTVWQLARDESDEDDFFVSTGGAFGGQESLFHIEPLQAGFGSYQLRWCHRLIWGTLNCGDVGFARNSRRLILLIAEEGEHPLTFTLKKATATHLLSSVV